MQCSFTGYETVFDFLARANSSRLAARSDVERDYLEAGQAVPPVSADSDEKWPHLSFGLARSFPKVIAIELASITAIIFWWPKVVGCSFW